MAKEPAALHTSAHYAEEHVLKKSKTTENLKLNL